MSLSERVQSLLKLPPPPSEPFGSEHSTRVFRASHRYYRLRLFRWIMAQIGTVTGLVFALGYPWADTIAPALGRIQLGPYNGADLVTSQGLMVLEIVSAMLFVLQIPFTLAMVRLDYDQRWYMVSDRSLRVREGLRRVKEQTMTIANIQNITIKQGPLQRMLAIADLRVRCAGGGSKEHDEDDEDGSDKSLHVAVFRGIDNADEVRDLLLAALKGGVKQPDSVRRQSTVDALSAELRSEARRLREVIRERSESLGPGG